MNIQDKVMNLRGKEYLEVKWRIVWFRQDHKGGQILTELMDNGTCKATIIIDGITVATGHGSANAGGRKVVWSGREVEKAETAAIGRALAHAGYGTQFTGDDEGDHLADSPVATPPPTNAQITEEAGKLGGVLMPAESMVKRFHALGNEIYGDEWNEQRKKWNVIFNVESSKELSRAQMQKLIDGMKRKGGA